ncbi:3-dehydroquinate synthase [Nitrosospira multiformis ATCC 25196]|uniref:3-dehydroquinate synthase n=2 Tax=Nitrosospira multiformis (strain ATCC 25196 / NCIMB 11849 / C 71) TaxID=323848 RepID=AROB_NITMU|nr:3-dehydroquinate synthase [Nitrosospira multiformis]Q2YB61.1 RecName: Full=3-dehydroquinate synthase; Short=DHQS [Nitrosospira multiformis ATCC 25196]ABB74010.1 3-dehydroquinate synthase [Nitrosospira multiformis ATCC 25196]SEF54339.1 3-dehydroquinate synthase [Nitrosospira multiformis ATCC 25196]
METVTVNLVSTPAQRGYPIHIGANILTQPELILDYLDQKRVAIVTNTTVGPLYLEKFRADLSVHGMVSVPIVLPDGEEYKNWETLNLIFDALLTHRCERNTPLIALGGGVVGDLTGFAAATYLRGVPFIQVPTTLLAQVDSSVGGKTGINHPLGKNMIGAFYQPQAVVADTSTLDTLPDRELRAGIAEVIKYGLIRDPAFFDWIESHIELLLRRDNSILTDAIKRSCQHKAEVVEEDERESGMRALLNLGHTFGHAIENAMGYGNWLHGEAVAAGTMLAAEVSRRMGMIGEEDVDRVRNLYVKTGLPVIAPNLGPEKYLHLMGLDKKVQGGKMRFILLENIGRATVHADVPAAILTEVLTECTADA